MACLPLMQGIGEWHDGNHRIDIHGDYLSYRGAFPDSVESVNVSKNFTASSAITESKVEPRTGGGGGHFACNLKYSKQERGE